MCLTKVATIHDKPKPETGFGWKAFDEVSERLITPLQGNVRFIPGEWVTDEATFHLLDEFGNIYPTGFHLFRTELDAGSYMKWRKVVIRKVEYSYVVATGVQNNSAVIVARKVRVCV